MFRFVAGNYPQYVCTNSNNDCSSSIKRGGGVSVKNRFGIISRRINGPGRGAKLTRSRSLALVKQYGKAGIVTHYSCSIVFVSLFFTATTYGVDTPYWVNRAKQLFISPSNERNSNPNKVDNQEVISEKAKWLTNLAVSVACYKLIFPVRAMMTTALTPIVIRYLRKNHPGSYLLK